MLNKEELAELDVLLEFKSTCCGVCRKMAPMVDTLIKDSGLNPLKLFLGYIF